MGCGFARIFRSIFSNKKPVEPDLELSFTDRRSSVRSEYESNFQGSILHIHTPSPPPYLSSHDHIDDSSINSTWFGHESTDSSSGQNRLYPPTNQGTLGRTKSKRSQRSAKLVNLNLSSNNPPSDTLTRDSLTRESIADAINRPDSPGYSKYSHMDPKLVNKQKLESGRTLVDLTPPNLIMRGTLLDDGSNLQRSKSKKSIARSKSIRVRREGDESKRLSRSKSRRSQKTLERTKSTKSRIERRYKDGDLRRSSDDSDDEPLAHVALANLQLSLNNKDKVRNGNI